MIQISVLKAVREYTNTLESIINVVARINKHQRLIQILFKNYNRIRQETDVEDMNKFKTLERKKRKIMNKEKIF